MPHRQINLQMRFKTHNRAVEFIRNVCHMKISNSVVNLIRRASRATVRGVHWTPAQSAPSRGRQGRVRLEAVLPPQRGALEFRFLKFE